MRLFEQLDRLDRRFECGDSFSEKLAVIQFICLNHRRASSRLLLLDHAPEIGNFRKSGVIAGNAMVVIIYKH